jgi:hypothetical protein
VVLKGGSSGTFIYYEGLFVTLIMITKQNGGCEYYEVKVHGIITVDNDNNVKSCTLSKSDTKRKGKSTGLGQCFKEIISFS